MSTRPSKLHRLGILVLASMLACAALLRAGELTTTTPTQNDPKRNQDFLDDIKKMHGEINLVFVGDSITDGWRWPNGKAVWKKNFERYKALNLGISGECTQHVLWRLQNGELEGYKARLFVLMIGTNNTFSGNAPADTAAGVAAILKEIQAKQPQAKILLMAIFPRGEKASDGLRLKNDEVNKLIAKFDDGKTVRYMDIGDKFLKPDKTLGKDVMWDLLHPTAKGYEIWATAILGAVRGIMGQ